MNAATAAGLLGGPVEIKIGNSIECEFERRQSHTSTLRIEVGNTHKCGSNTIPLKAIGNEAVACGEEGKNGERLESVVGRVRDQAFFIRIATKDRSATPASLLEQVRSAAEQVVGNLF